MSSTLFWERQLWIDENFITWPGNGENERNIIDITTIQEDYIDRLKWGWMFMRLNPFGSSEYVNILIL